MGIRFPLGILTLSLLYKEYKMSRNTKIMCGVPTAECRGAVSASTNGMGAGKKMHTDHEQAKRCYVAWLLRQGYEQIGSREFRPPKTPEGESGGPILVLNKVSKFGSVMRTGKEGNRHMPRKRTGGTIT